MRDDPTIFVPPNYLGFADSAHDYIYATQNIISNIAFLASGGYQFATSVLNYNLPAVANGQLRVLHIQCDLLSLVSGPVGWTAVIDATNRGAVYYRFKQAGDTDIATVVATGGTPNGVAACYSNVAAVLSLSIDNTGPPRPAVINMSAVASWYVVTVLAAAGLNPTYTIDFTDSGSMILHARPNAIGPYQGVATNPTSPLTTMELVST